jgi:hypothetical protein
VGVAPDVVFEAYKGFSCESERTLDDRIMKVTLHVREYPLA